MSNRHLVSKSEFARMKRVSAAAVTYWARDGRIVMVDGKVDVEASEEALNKTGHPTHGGKRPVESEAAPASGARVDLIRSKSRQADTRAKLDDLEYRERVGELIEKARSDAAIADGMELILSQLRTLSVRVCPKLLGETDLRKSQQIVDDEVERLCQETADTLRAMISGARISRQ